MRKRRKVTTSQRQVGGIQTVISRCKFQWIVVVFMLLFWLQPICTAIITKPAPLGPELFQRQATDPAATQVAGDTIAQHLNKHQQQESSPSTSSGASRPVEEENGEGSHLEHFLQTLPVLSVGQKHKALFECELDERHASSRLAWIRLDRARNDTVTSINPISLDLKIISPDRRFKVHRQSPLKWLLSLDNVSSQDHQAYFLCQPSADLSASQPHRANSAHNGFVNGAQLHVLVPPKIVLEETSPSLVQANEWEPISLRCKVNGEPRSELTWKREDGRSIDGGQLSFRHQLERRPNQLVSIDSSELHFASFERHQAGAYLCIASNGVQPGVSQRINVRTVNCRQSSLTSSVAEQCDQIPVSSSSSTQESSGSSSSTVRPLLGNWRQRPSAVESARRAPTSRANDKRRNGRTEAKSGNSSRELASSNSSAMKLISLAVVLFNSAASLIISLFVILSM